MRIWWYIASQYLKTSLSMLFFALCLFFILTYMEDSQHYFNSYNPSKSAVFFYYFWQIPVVTILFLPFSVLLGGIITNWMLSRHGEIAALQAAGLSLRRIAFPMLCVGLLFTAGQFIVSEVILPQSMIEFIKIRNIQIEKKQNNKLFTESHWLKSQNAVMHFDKYENQILYGVEYFKADDFIPLQQIVYAKSGYFDEKQHVWVLHDATVANFNASSKFINSEIASFYTTDVDFAPPKVLSQTSDSSELSYWQLRKLITEAQQAGANVSDRIVDLNLKLSAPFANLLFVFLTLPFAMQKERHEERYLGIIICLAIALIYWIGGLVMRSFAIKGELNPLFAAWAMNILVVFVCYMTLRRLERV